MSRVAALSDIHGNLPALKAVIADAEARGCTAFINLGDVLSGPLWPRETAEFLMAQGWPTIAGNHERYLREMKNGKGAPSDRHVYEKCTQAQLAWLAALPQSMSVYGAWCTHAQPANDEAYLLETVDEGGARPASEAEIMARLEGAAYPLILHGHSHLPRDVTLTNGQRIANPGSVGLPAYFEAAPYPHAMETGSSDARYLILDEGEITLCAARYDSELAAREAERNGSARWAHYLRHGLAK